MKKHNRIIAGIMAVCLMGGVAVIPESIAPMVSITASAETIKSGTCGENLTWVLDDEGTLTISGTGDMADFWRNDDTPWYSEKEAINKVVIEVGVTSISEYAFYDAENLKSVIISDSVTSIGYDAFLGCSSLKSVTIPDSVTSIGDRAFYGTLWLEEKQEENPLVIVNNIVIYGQKCHGDVIIPDGVTSIGDGSFSSCTGLTSIIIPDSVTSIGDYVFNGCLDLTEITIPDSVTSIGDGAFVSCTSLTSIIIPDSVTSIGDGAFSSCTGLTSIIIPDSVISIEYHEFSGCSSLISVTIPNSVTSICGGAFFACNSLTSVTIPDSVTSIGGLAFSSCENLTEITILNPECEIDDHERTISNGYDRKNDEYYFNGTIYGYEGSTAQEYAEKYNRKFVALDGNQPEENTATGDMNGDGDFNVSDVVTFQKYILGGSDTEISDWKQADFTGDGVLDVFDLCLMRKKLIEK